MHLPTKMIPDIVKAITRAIQQGWFAGGIPQVYSVAPIRDDFNAIRSRVSVPNTTTTTASRGRGNPRVRGGSRGRGSGRGRGATRATTATTNTQANTTPNTYQTPTTSHQTAPRQPNQLYNRRQFPMHVPQVQDAILGFRINFTKLKYEPRYCNNFQVWGKCAVHEYNAQSCNYFKRCSNCDSQSHGRRVCPTLPTNESGNV